VLLGGPLAAVLAALTAASVTIAAASASLAAAITLVAATAAGVTTASVCSENVLHGKDMKRKHTGKEAEEKGMDAVPPLLKKQNCVSRYVFLPSSSQLV
jgi:hypothetical protein